jgi:phage gpG-like protein
MGIRLSGNTASLHEFASKLQTIPNALPRAAAKMAPRAKGELFRNFASKRDPYHKRWAPRVRSAAHPLMRKTGALRGSISSSASGRTFTVSFGTSYGVYHQGGTSRMVARMLIPLKGRIPRVWLPWMDDIVRQMIHRHLG